LLLSTTDIVVDTLTAPRINNIANGVHIPIKILGFVLRSASRARKFRGKEVGRSLVILFIFCQIGIKLE